MKVQHIQNFLMQKREKNIININLKSLPSKKLNNLDILLVVLVSLK